MKKEALRKAKRALDRAEDCLTNMAFSHPASEEFSDNWDDFLHRLNRIEEVLKAGSLRHNKSAPYFGRFRHEQKRDPLLRYVHAARNAEHHGLVTSSQPMVRQFEVIYYRAMDYGDDHIYNDPRNYTQEEVYADLVSVKDRFGKTFAPPTEHLGKRILDRTPQEVARLALIYYKKLVSGAAEFT